jgi:hypothetical protein
MAPYIKFIPTVLLVAIAGYLAWGYCEDAAPAPPAVNLPAVGAEHLHPTQPPQLTRDPFGDTVRFELGELVDATKKGRPVVTAPTGDKKTTTTVANPKSTGQKTTGGTTGPGAITSVTKPNSPGIAGAKPGSTTGPAGANAPAGAKSTPTPLVLNATLIYGDSRVALINGHVYRLGDRLDNGSTEGESLRVADIRHDRVLLERAGKQTELTYSNESTTGPAPKRGAAPAKPALAGAKKTPTQPAAGDLAKTQPTR